MIHHVNWIWKNASTIVLQNNRWTIEEKEVEQEKKKAECA